MDLQDLVRQAAAAGASDIHLGAGLPPVFRIDGVLHRWGETPLEPGRLATLAAACIPTPKQEEFRRRGEADFSCTLPGVTRYRVSVYRQQGTVAMAIRLIPLAITPLHQLNLPPGVADTLAALCDRPWGLVLITGPTGSGKTTTLAAMIDHINHRRPAHIITLEDPIEYVHPPRRAVVHQREVGVDTESFARGLRAALRQDPDVILVGEMRDLETIQTALEAAETGHLVLATLHTGSACATVDRIIDVFPPEHQPQVRIQVANTLQAVVCQRLFRRRDGPGRLAAAEVLVVTPAVRNLIREAKTHQILSAIQTGARLGMRTMAASVQELYERGAIAPDDYLAFVQDQLTSPFAADPASGRVPARATLA